MTKHTTNRRDFLKSSAVIGAGVAAPMIFVRSAHAYRNEPKGGTVTFGFNVPQTGAYADEGAVSRQLCLSGVGIPRPVQYRAAAVSSSSRNVR